MVRSHVCRGRPRGRLQSVVGLLIQTDRARVWSSIEQSQASGFDGLRHWWLSGSTTDFESIVGLDGRTDSLCHTQAVIKHTYSSLSLANHAQTALETRTTSQ